MTNCPTMKHSSREATRKMLFPPSLPNSYRKPPIKNLETHTILFLLVIFLLLVHLIFLAHLVFLTLVLTFMVILLVMLLVDLLASIHKTDLTPLLHLLGDIHLDKTHFSVRRNLRVGTALGKILKGIYNGNPTESPLN